ncbi:hypothetical protein [Synechococcus sp. MU1611]|uniref:hypothetical protein n=1 Tax=Synechococcus sp. MU1611 TaxID=2508345 RepID=UPI001CF8D529|nr:hypothetical protein [Synechococcus sp. MU1611]MCB4412308.1 hypothetical protein [Synechococcus sp. MU1611]
MTLRSVLLDDTWTPKIRNIINSDLDIELISYYFSDVNSNNLGFEEFARDVISEVDAALDLDFVEAPANDSTTIDFYIRDWTGADGDTLGLCTWYGSGYITSETFVKPIASLNHRHNSYNTFVHEFGHALGLGEPGFDARWDQDDTAMSYNSNVYGEYRTSFAPADWSALESLWGVEDFILVGDSNANTLQAQYGAVHADSIDGSDGNDTLRGYGGGDYLIGGNGNDLMGGNFGRDTLVGGAGNDEMNGGQGGDDMSGGPGADIVRGGAGKNTISAGANDGAADKVYVHADSVLYGRPTDGSFADLLNDLEANDRIYIHGVEGSQLSFQMASLPSSSEQGVGIFANGALEAVATGGLGVDQVIAMTEGGFF